MPETKSKISEKENILQESMDVNQGKLVLGLDLDVDNEEWEWFIWLVRPVKGEV